MRGTTLEGCPDIITPVYECKKSKIKTTACHVNRASEAGHVCERYLVFARTRWEEKLLHDVELEFIFDGGRMVEKLAFKELEEAGFTLVEQNRPFSWKEFNLTGHVDAKILIGDRNAGEPSMAYPIEVKGLNQFDYDKLDTIEDFIMSKKSWIKKYPAQLCLYMLMSNIEYGCFYIKRLPGFRPKQIWISLDYTFAEDILKKLERINKHVKEDTIPEPIKDYDICKYCGFLHICFPDFVGKEIEIIDEIEIEEAIRRAEELKPAYSEYNKQLNAWKEALKEREKVIIGPYLVIGKWVDKKAYSVPESRYWGSKVMIKPGAEALREEE